MVRIEQCDEHFYFEDALQLGSYAFQSPLTQERRETKRKRLSKEWVYGSFEKDQLVSKLHLIPLQMYIKNKRFDFGGIASIATWPEFRRRGHVKRLMSHSLEVMKNKGMAVSMLHPFSISFYRRFGWELTQEMRKVSISITDIPEFVATKGYTMRTTYQEHKEELHILYEQVATQYGLLMKRDNFWWENRVITEGTTIALSLNEDGIPDGYALTKLENNILHVEEMIYSTYNAWSNLLNWIKNHDSMVDNINMVLLPDDPMLFYLANPRVKETRHAYFMSRIVVLESFLEGYPFAKNKISCVLHLHVEDEMAPWNNGNWTLTVSNGVGSVQNGHIGQADVLINGPIQSFTSLLLNSQSIHHLQMFKALEIKGEPQKVSSLLTDVQPAFLDFF
ncbi:GNAT family N-acetyltransferase [Pontibacillus yanchengensis]|uniref:GNAT family N-acetyltransferase n=2 Tax=Pontibacillus yanchengensis TaxID=462910 RepID=A0ACC7VDB8_9BACI|nr:GNAT family N-acetyltransferase [Pontibacillus yanchengensis]MYL33011.1 GNAT family N-acetyltransferase [Pontibacillus yanchengensis]MYL52139.1 GNAT family N-acetyltransferase [Pontibacillus yanchengensis]